MPFVLYCEWQIRCHLCCCAPLLLQVSKIVKPLDLLQEPPIRMWVKKPLKFEPHQLFIYFLVGNHLLDYTDITELYRYIKTGSLLGCWHRSISISISQPWYCGSERLLVRCPRRTMNRWACSVSLEQNIGVYARGLVQSTCLPAQTEGKRKEEFLSS